MAAAGDGDRPQLGGRRAELVHVPSRDGREVYGLGKPAEGHLEVLLDEVLGVHLARTADHLGALRGPRDREDVEDVARLAPTDRQRGVVGRRPRPDHPAAALRDPELVRGPEVRMEGRCVELVTHEGRVHEAVDVRRGEPGIRERALHGFRGDLLRGPARRPGVRRLSDPDDGDFPSDVLERRRAAPVGVGHAGTLAHASRQGPGFRRAAGQCLIAVGGAGSRERMPSAFCCEVLPMWCAA